MGNIKIEKMVLGMVQTNTWFVINEKTKELILIDPADDAGRIIRKIEADGLKLQGILLTHGHFDHIGAVDDLRAYFKGVQCYAGEKEEEVLENGSYNLSASWAAALSIRADRLLRDKETLTLAGFKIKVIETPGHTKGGVCYYLSEEELKEVEGEFTPSAFVRTITGVENVCERSAVLASGNGSLIRKKTGREGVTTALGLRKWEVHFE